MERVYTVKVSNREVSVNARTYLSAAKKGLKVVYPEVTVHELFEVLEEDYSTLSVKGDRGSRFYYIESNFI